ncbi:uncharacterized protein BXZ73DRAFT_97040 [Epithele typhae]|uniref:uncharacterized protein n=1 Tax=Epithele typhae TaxID=378194 RepID=UPI0020082AEE|nr:uncharacterized protein BXZ73DRAFT_97040 [Epithele typhae]KAH9944561.1 hypothetical protein BXZ73DRAFT_97040 [Epithele typhae]
MNPYAPPLPPPQHPQMASSTVPDAAVSTHGPSPANPMAAQGQMQEYPNAPLLFRHLENTFFQTLDRSYALTMARFDRVEIVLGGISKNTNERLDQTAATLQQTKDAVTELNTARRDDNQTLLQVHGNLLQASKIFLGKAERLEQVMGSPSATNADGEGAPTVLERLQRLERSIAELVETLGDPTLRSLSSSTMRSGSTLPLSCVLWQTPEWMRLISSPSGTLDAVVQSEQPSMVDVGVEAREVELPSPAYMRYSTASQTVYGSSPDPQDEEATRRSAPARIKREANKSSSHDQRPAKRRKTMGAVKLETSSASRAGGESKSAISKSTKRASNRRKGRPFVTTPIKLKVKVPPSSPQVTPKTKRRYEAPQIGTNCPWPNKVDDDGAGEMVACDNCNGWYHYGCVGLVEDDPRAEDDWHCPPCETSEEVQELRREVAWEEAACLRPDCDHPGSAEDTGQYFIERIIGRRPFDPATDWSPTEGGSKFMWLVKWDGYPVGEATWSSDHCVRNCRPKVENFLAAAEIENKNLADKRKVLLNEASAAGL